MQRLVPAGPLAAALLAMSLPAADAAADDSEALAACLISSATEADHDVYRQVLLAALTDAPTGELREKMKAFSSSIVRLGVRDCGMAPGDFQTEAGRQAANLYGQHVGRAVVADAMSRLQQ